MYKNMSLGVSLRSLRLEGGDNVTESPYVLSMVIMILVYGHCDSSGVCLCVTCAVSCHKRWLGQTRGRVA